MRELLRAKPGETPAFVTISSHQKVAEAIAVMERYSISQLPVVRDGERDSLADVIGSLQDRALLDLVFKNADALHEDVAVAMQGPLAAVDADASVDEIVTALDGRDERGRRRRRRAGRSASSRAPTCSSTSRTPVDGHAARAALAQIRRTIVAAQGYAAASGAPATPRSRHAIRRLSAVQLDSISTVDRAHRLTISARVGAFEPDTVPSLLRAGRLFEYWAHEASLLPVELWPHFRRTMDGCGPLGLARPRAPTHADLVEPILGRIRDEGPLGSRDFEGRRRRRHVELEAREDGARRALGPGRARDRRAAELPACSTT